MELAAEKLRAKSGNYSERAKEEQGDLERELYPVSDVFRMRDRGEVEINHSPSLWVSTVWARFEPHVCVCDGEKRWSGTVDTSMCYNIVSNNSEINVECLIVQVAVWSSAPSHHVDTFTTPSRRGRFSVDRRNVCGGN
jgi:hypothetical protein